MVRRFLIPVILLTVFCCIAGLAHAQAPGIDIQIGGDEPQNLTVTLQVILLITVLTLAPALLVMVTSFTRIVIVLSLLRHALSTQQIPPNQVIIGLSLFLTFFIMTPVFNDINTTALQPYFNEEISQQEAFNRALVPLRGFMFSHVREADLALFLRAGNFSQPANRTEVPTQALIPAFVVSELRTAFEMGFLLFIPFLIIDMVVASVLMSMGMMMLPPIMVSLPFKILLFVLVDGWHLLIQSLVQSFS